MPPRSVAQAFADHLNALLNRTVTDARLTVIGDPGRPARFTLACLRGTTPSSFALHGSSVRLLVVQALRVTGEHCQTLTYQYRLSLGEDKQSWLMRWEYFRDRPTPAYPYPLAHVHVNADPSRRGRRDAGEAPHPDATRSARARALARDRRMGRRSKAR